MAWFVSKPLFFFVLGVGVLYYALIFIDSTFKNSSLPVGVVSVIAATVQLSAYAIGMVTEFFKGSPKPANRNQ
jgi:UDP-N-acetylmuramyl pentapeptide phosphotransferase/UDP-N-acetylglucosamine-1-phosphate transferase